MTATLESIAEQIRSGQHDAAAKALDTIKPADPDMKNEAAFLRGYLQESMLDREDALATYEKLLEQDPDHTEAAFRAALILDQGGDDDEAIDLYERCTAHPPAHANALINLALLYEERARLPEAEALLQTVLDDYPEHARARQFLQSVQSSYEMMIDERSQRERDKRDAIMDTPISDFELSVRSRNCLKQMNLRTVGDLLRISEQELLAYKNFGETSLNEIKAVLLQKGLKLGQIATPVEPPPVVPAFRSAVADSSMQLKRPVSELELSVRSRKCLQRLGIASLGELTQRSEAELLAIKNFGLTSLQEIKRQLATIGLTLRNPL